MIVLSLILTMPAVQPANADISVRPGTARCPGSGFPGRGHRPAELGWGAASPRSSMIVTPAADPGPGGGEGP